MPSSLPPHTPGANGIEAITAAAALIQ